ncbi:hypothetical protein ABZS86_03920 [Streptomyces sp. NPDC005355]|uniref:hypothetical protein n=1 Tax=Streptomyces sp. NPDC005355 TaxID=3157038 RepID=UPI0033B4D503
MGRAVRPWVSTGRLQYSVKQVVGERYCLTSHAAGFIDALYSRGLANTLELVNALGWRLIAASRDGDWSMERFSHVEALQQGLFDFHDDLVYSSFVGFGHYDLWNAVNRTWMLGTMSGNMMVEDAYYRYSETGDPQVFLEAERSGHPGSPLPISESFVRLGTMTRELCESVEQGTVAPADAAARRGHRSALAHAPALRHAPVRVLGGGRGERLPVLRLHLVTTAPREEERGRRAWTYPRSPRIRCPARNSPSGTGSTGPLTRNERTWPGRWGWPPRSPCTTSPGAVYRPVSMRQPLRCRPRAPLTGSSVTCRRRCYGRRRS